MKAKLIFLVLLAACLAPRLSAEAQGPAPLVLNLTAEGPISSAMAEYLTRGLNYAEQRGAELLVLQLNTPGGSIEIMNRIKQEILASKVPVVVYVAPRGAMAASAGTVITLAGHAAAMAPDTVIGAASPVGNQGEDLGTTLETKVKEVLKADVRGLAGRRGSQAVSLAESMIESAKAVSASEALQAGLVDFIAINLDDLLRQLDGFTVTLDGSEKVLNTSGAVVEDFNPSLIEQILGVLTNPNIVFLLMSIGLQAILIELSHPGGWVAGTIGVVCLALGTYGLGVLDVNWFGIIFLVLAFILFIVDIKATAHGALTAAGVASLIVGALVLFNSPGTPDFQRVSVPLVVATSLVTGGLFLVVLTLALRAQAIPVLMGHESLVGRTGTVRGNLSRSGLVQVGSERWSAELAEGESPLSNGEPIEVTAIKGLRLVVRKRQP
jgi:membrane-bound serine protease (ClpP class)